MRWALRCSPPTAASQELRCATQECWPQWPPFTFLHARARIMVHYPEHLSGGRGCLGEGRLGVPSQVWEFRFLRSFPAFPREDRSSRNVWEDARKFQTSFFETSAAFWIFWGTSKQHMKWQQPWNYDCWVSQFRLPRSQSGNDREMTTSPPGYHWEEKLHSQRPPRVTKLQQLRASSREWRLLQNLAMTVTCNDREVTS